MPKDRKKAPVGVLPIVSTICPYNLNIDLQSLPKRIGLKYPSHKKGKDMADIKKEFGVRLFQLRNDAGMTQAEIAEKANLSVDSISRIERGDRAPSFESLERIAVALGTDPVQLLNFEGKEIRALAECSPDALELWKFLRKKKPDQIKKLHEIGKIIF